MNDENHEKDALGASLIKTIYDPHLTKIIQDYGELAIDALIQDDLLKEIPVIGTAVRLTKMGIAIRDRNFLKKILRFIQEFETNKSLIPTIFPLYHIFGFHPTRDNNWSNLFWNSNFL